MVKSRFEVCSGCLSLYYFSAYLFSVCNIGFAISGSRDEHHSVIKPPNGIQCDLRYPKTVPGKKQQHNIYYFLN